MTSVPTPPTWQLHHLFSLYSVFVDFPMHFYLLEPILQHLRYFPFRRRLNTCARIQINKINIAILTHNDLTIKKNQYESVVYVFYLYLLVRPSSAFHSDFTRGIIVLN